MPSAVNTPRRSVTPERNVLFPVPITLTCTLGTGALVAASRTVTRTRPLPGSSRTSTTIGVTSTMPEAYRFSPRAITR